MTQFKKYFGKALKSNYPAIALQLSSEVDKEFEMVYPDVKFARTSSNPVDRRLIFCAYFLALIKVLDKHNESFEKIRAISLEVVKEYVRPKNFFQAFLKKLLPRFTRFGLAQAALKLLAKKVSKKGHADGFVATIIFDKKETYGFGYGVDILECGICKLFNKHGYKKYAPILCEVDEVTSSLAGLKLIRTGTIANGAPKCDFRYMRV